jgi:hypothetical protein
LGVGAVFGGNNAIGIDLLDTSSVEFLPDDVRIEKLF